MANTTIRLKKSGVVSNVPASLELGELALNYADGKLYYKNSDDVITYISSGATTNSFATINSNSSLILATSNTDILSFGGANGISITTDTLNKVITINGRALENRLIHLEEWDDAQNDIIFAVSSSANEAQVRSQEAFNKANSANSLAQAAFDYANTITGGGSTTTFFNYLTVQKQLYTANASQTNFFVNYTPPYVTVVINGATVDASEYSTGTANTVILNTPTSAGDVVDITGFYQANSASISASGADQWVRDTANSAVANTIITQGVDVWQNTQITAVNNYAASAYDKANNSLSLTGGTITGNLTVSQDLYVSGNLYLSGNATTISTNNVTLNDSLIYLAQDNPANTVDIGIVGHFTEGHYQHTGVVRNHLNGNWVFFSNVSTEPSTTINFAEANIVYDSITTGGIITPTATINGKDWQSVEDTQNTSISLALELAGGASVALSEIGVLYGIEATQNTNITAVNGYAASAYATANAANNMAVGAYNQANTAYGAGVNNANDIINVNLYSQGAYAKANAALANTTGTFAGSLTTTGNVIINSGISSTSNTTGSLRITGGVGVTGNVYADKIFVNGLYWAANGNVISTGGSTGNVNQFNIYKYLATAGQTTFSGPDSASVSLNYTVGAIIVTLNGLTLKPGTDFTATNGSSIVLTVAADLNDELNIYGFTSTTVNTANTLSVFSYSASAGQTSFGGVDQNGNSLGYLPGNLFTTYNGITLRNGVDYTAANGSYINLTFSAAANDEIVVYTFGAFNVANTYTIQQADAKFTTAGKSLAINFFRS